MTVATWSPFGSQYFKGVDPQKVSDEILSIGDEATPQQIVDAARSESAELHKCFEWNDSRAAEQYRLQQARDVVRNLVIERREEKPEAPQIRYFYKTDNGSGYKPSVHIFKVDDEYQSLLQRAYAELRAFKAKYSSLKELEEILALID